MVRRQEWRWVLVVGALALTLSSVPYLLGVILRTDERIFGGFVYAVEDGYSYLAKMRQGAQGAWLFHLAYTPEPHPGALVFPFHLLLGKVAALLPGPDLTSKLVWTYHAARLILGMGLLLTVYRFLAALTPSEPVRRLALLLVAFGGGLAWLLVALGQPEWLGSLPLDLILPEGFTFLVLYAFPHIALARTLLLWGMLFLLQAWGESPQRRSASSQPAERAAGVAARTRPCAALAGLAWLVMGLIVPFYAGVAWAVTGAMWVALAVRRVSRATAERIPDRRRPGARLRHLPWRELGQAALAGLLSAPAAAYNAWVFLGDPVYRTWAAQNLVLSPHPLHYLAAFGVPLLLAVLVARRVWQEDGLLWPALAWVAVVPVLVYLPFNLQRRLVEGVQVPLSLLAARAAHDIQRTTARISRSAAVVALLAVLVPTNALLVAGNCLALLSRSAPVFRDAGEVVALDWLSGQASPADVVLAAYETGNYLPARVGARVFVGHGPETVRFGEKRALVARFFQAGGNDAWRQDLLAEYGVDWIFWGPSERALGAFDPSAAPYLELGFQRGEYAILHVTR
jgi:hypothetical protein